MKSSTLSLIIVTVVIIIGAYWYISTGEDNQPPLTTAVLNNAAQTQFQALVNELQPISFNVAIFSEPNFLSLVDLTTPIEPESSGRLDPFAPVSGIMGN